MSEEKVQVSEAFAEKAQSVASALSGLGQDTFGGSAGQPSLLDSIEVKPSGDPSKTEVSNQNPGSGTDNNQGENGTNPQSAATSGDQAQQNAASTEGSEGDFEIDSPITGKIKVGKPAEEIKPVSFENIEDFDKFAKDNGFEDSKKFVEELPKLLETKTKYEEVSKVNANYEAVFENMPPELFAAVQKWSHGEDWRNQVSATEPVNLSIEYGKQDSQQLVDKYFPNKISKEEWEEFKDKDGDETVKEKVNNYLSLTKDKYEIDQEKFKTQKEQYDRKAAQSVQARKESLDKSRVSVFETFKSSGLPLDEKYVEGLDKKLSSDQQILSMFKNDDGTLRTDAHQRLAMADAGFGLVTQYQKALERKIVTKAREEILDRAGSGSQAMKKSGDSSGSGKNESEEKVKSYVASVLPTSEGKTY